MNKFVLLQTFSKKAKMKNIYTLLLLFITFSASVSAQVQTAESSSADSLINVIAYFCKNDTMGYNFQHVKMKVIDNDTTVNYYCENEFQLIVRDSTSEGYKIEFQPISHHFETPEDTVMTQMMEKLINSLGDVPLIFTTDEYGTIQHVENWREVRDLTRKMSKALTDSLYALRPEMETAVARQRLEASINMQFANEQAVLNAYEELAIMFGLHGKSYKIGKTEADVTSDNGYPQHVTCVASYGKTSEDDGFDDDYYINSLSEITIPAKDVGNLMIDQLNMMSEHKMTEEEQKVMTSAIDEDAKVSIVEGYDMFFNGWPCDMEYDKITDLKNVRNMEIYRIQWTSRVWGIYGGSDEQQDGVSM